jgi:dinuclear metal center YbgI/SA1388 family protein
MAAELKEILACLDAAWPFAWAIPEDRVGLQVGRPDQPVRRILVALEVSEAVVAEAVAVGADLLLTHHPLLYTPLKEVREDRPGGQLVAAVIRAGLSVIACHTNLDLAPQGLNDYLAARLGLVEVAPLLPVSQDPWVKLAVFVPVGYEDRVRTALCDDRVGVIGRYTHCSFAARGQGTYRPEEGAKPFHGEIARLSRAEEVRLEVLAPESRLPATLTRLRAAHPYEAVAYDLYPLKNPGHPLGFGRLGCFPEPRAWPEVTAILKSVFGVPAFRVWGRAPEQVSRVAVCGGSGGDLIAAAREGGAHLFVTGEVRHHQALPGFFDEFAIAEVGHFTSEAVYMPAWADEVTRLLAQHGLAVEVSPATREEPPFQIWAV